MQNRIAGKKIIVTGASSGIGEQIAWQIAENGGVPIMVARSINKLQNQQMQIKKVHQVNSYAYQADLLNQKELDKVIVQILSEHSQIHGLINNAGAGVFDYVKDLRWTDVERMFQLNVFALIQGTKLLLPHFIEHQEGHVINVASQAGKIATPKAAGYAATKHAVLGFTNSLRLETSDYNIRVTSVNLGPVKTNFFAGADSTGDYQKNMERYMLPPDKVAAKIVKALFTDKREINLPGWMELGSKLYHLFPGTMERLLKKQFNRK
ncbi:SDR family NAD(P)-dependent oxidoreductase [Virgibacillus siamensis]|uniref:SDR family NAD(P)-dependent oxidoreductase n=1 Tax=Virgibacillus siamensis TaxID=480071 RepID=UPI000986FD31|nr:SDR family oxidoreductase [Virgibacillus siamensis]